jgi:molecular chaperone HscB
MDLSLSGNYFELFGLPQSFTVDLPRLDDAFRALQSRLHPDRFANTSQADRIRSLQASTYVNAAYATLRDPLNRARHLLELAGVDFSTDCATAMPREFLVEQIQWREAMERAHRGADESALCGLEHRLHQEIAAHQTELSRMLEQARDFEGAANCLRKLGFYDSLRRDLREMIEAVVDTRVV